MKLYGPQSDREKSIGRTGMPLSVGISQNSTSQRRDLNRSDRELDSHTVETELGRLQRENSLLSDQLQRSLKVVKAYQLKFPSAYIEIKSENDSDNILPPWSTAADAFLPLFDCYDTRIKELEDVINLKAMELSKFQAIVDSITEENEQLRDLQINQIRLQGSTNNNQSSNNTFDYNENILSLSHHHKFDTNNVLQMELLSELNERNDILMTENGLLTEQKLALSTELEHHHIQLNNLNQEYHQLQMQLTAVKKENNQLLQKCQQLETDRNEAGKQALNYSNLLSKSEAQLNSLQSQYHITKSHENELIKSIQDTKKELQSLTKEYDEQTHKTMRNVKVLEDRIRELQIKYYEKTQEVDSLNETLRKLKREYQNTRQDAEAMLQVMSGLEKQVSEYAAREAEVEKIANDSKIKVAEALSVRDQTLVKEKLMNEEIKKLMDENKKISREKFDKIEEEILLTQSKGKEQLLNSEKEMQSLVDIIAKLRTEYETSIRESKTAQDHIERLKRLRQDDTRLHEEGINILQAKLNESINSKEIEIQKRNEVQEQNKELRLTIDRLRSQVDSMKSQLLQSDRQRKSDSNTVKSMIKQLEIELTDKSKQLDKANIEIDQLRNQLESIATTMETKSQEDVSNYRQRALEAEKTLKEYEESLSQSDQRTQYLIQKMKESSEQMAEQLETQIDNEREKLRVLVEKTSDRDEQILLLTEENKRLLFVIDEAKDTIQQLQDDLDDKHEKINVLTDQLITTSNEDDFLSRYRSVLNTVRPMDSDDIDKDISQLAIDIT